MRRISLFGAALLAGGCTSLPEFDKVSGVRPNTIVDTIQCELVAARARIEKLRAEGKVQRSLCDFVAVADLSLQVDEQMTLAPSLSHTNVVSQSLTRVFDWGLKYDTQAQRTFAQSVTFKVNQLNAPEKGCPANGSSLNGNLGLVEAVIMGLTTIDPTDVGVALASDDDAPGGRSAAADCAKYAKDDGKYAVRSLARSGSRDRGEGKKKNAFSTQIEFVVTRNVNSTGPTWTLQHFKGPGKLFSTQRTDTHSVTIAFANSEGSAKEQGNKAAIDGLKNSLRSLQRAP